VTATSTLELVSKVDGVIVVDIRDAVIGAAGFVAGSPAR
jgi:hypothetical protein